MARHSTRNSGPVSRAIEEAGNPVTVPVRSSPEVQNVLADQARRRRQARAGETPEQRKIRLDAAAGIVRRDNKVR